MSKIYEDNSLTIGNTPLVRLNRVSNGKVLAKVEARNPSFSVKCRIGASMIWEAEKSEILLGLRRHRRIAQEFLARPHKTVSLRGILAEMAQGDSRQAIEVFLRHHSERPDLRSQTTPGPAARPTQQNRIGPILRIFQQQNERLYLQ